MDYILMALLIGCVVGWYTYKLEDRT